MTNNRNQISTEVTDQIGKLCHDLKIPALFENLQKQLQDPDYLDIPFGRRLLEMLQAEKESRYSKRIKRLMKDSEINDAMPSLERLTYEPSRGLDRDQVEDLAECVWITQDHPLNVIITGMAGTGKTWLAKSLAKQAVYKNLPTKYWRAPQLIERLIDARKHGEPAQFRNRMNFRRLLVIDDFAMTPMDEQTCDDFLSLIDDRAGKGSLIIASQRPFREWYDYLGGNYHADALIDRLKNSSYRLELKGRSLRESTEQSRLVNKTHKVPAK